MSMRFRPTGRAVGVLLLALVLIASGCGGDDDDDSSSATSSGGGATLDTTLVFGGPPECLERPLCLGDKEQELYGLDFKEVKKLDPGGPVTVKALQDGTIDVGLLVHRQQRHRPQLRAARGRQGSAAGRQPDRDHQREQGGRQHRRDRRLGERSAHARRVQHDGARGVQRQGRPVGRRRRRSSSGPVSPRVATPVPALR